MAKYDAKDRRCTLRPNRFGKLLGGHDHHDGGAVQGAKRNLNRALRSHSRRECALTAAGVEEPLLPLRGIVRNRSELSHRCT